MPAVRCLAAQDFPAVATIVSALPEYFTEDVAGQVRRDATGHDGWVLTDADQIVAFAITARKSAAAAEILWMAVDPGRRGRRYGSVLLTHSAG